MCLVPWDRVRPRLLQMFSPTIPVAVALYVVSDLLSLTMDVGGGIANAAHLTGVAVGILYTWTLWKRAPGSRGRPLPLFEYVRRRRPPIRKAK